MKISYLIISILVLTSVNLIGDLNKLKNHTQMNLDCKTCHICDTPTKADPCLILCPRDQIKTVAHHPNEGPDSILINQVKGDVDLYHPVNFSHKTHAEMSLFSDGCSMCHHFNPNGNIIKCSDCHETNRERIDLSIPDIKAAYHRQCMDCHKTWEENSECENCHLLKQEFRSINESKTKMVVSHTKIEIPKRIVYETESEEGINVTFHHNDHQNLFGFECSDCHKNETCANCHAKNKPVLTNVEEHDRCSSCHDTEDNCNKCHKEEITSPFVHKVKTGFSLKEFHNKLNCIDCHNSKRNFKGLKKNCIACHSNEEGYFNHSITGLELDEIHYEFNCSDCHKKEDYKRKPNCDDCHEDISFPEDIPGERINAE